MLLIDTYSLNGLTVLKESKSNGKTVLRGKFGEAEKVNRNRRKYSLADVKREVAALQESIRARTLVGELDHPTTATVSYKNASHLITELYMEGNNIMGEMEILTTPMGLIAEALIRDGVKIGVSSRALGTVTSLQEGTLQVGSDLKYICWDIVADPSCVGANPMLVENVTNNLIDEYRLKLPELRKERVYIQALKESFIKNKGYYSHKDR